MHYVYGISNKILRAQEDSAFWPTKQQDFEMGRSHLAVGVEKSACMDKIALWLLNRLVWFDSLVVPTNILGKLPGMGTPKTLS